MNLLTLRAADSWRRPCVLLWLLVLVYWPVNPAADGQLVIGAVDGDGWRAEGIALVMELGVASPSLELHLDRLAVEALTQPFTNVHITCRAWSLSVTGAHCPRAGLAFNYGAERYRSSGSVRWLAGARRAVVSLPELALPWGRIALSATFDAAGLRLQAEAPALDPALLAEQLALPVSLAAGEAALSIDWQDGRLTLSGQFNDLAFSDASGRLAGETLAGRVDLTARHDGAQWHGEVGLRVTAGGVYAEPVFVDFGAYPVEATTRFAYRHAPYRLALEDLDIVQRAALTLEGSLVSSAGALVESATLEFSGMAFPAVYETYFAGALVGTPAANLETGGRATARLDWRAGALDRVALTLDAVDVEDRDGRFALYALDGEINWARNGADLAASRISFGGGYFHGAGFDASTFELGIAGEAIDLLEPVSVPLLGGALVIERFSLRDYGSDDLELGLDARLEPIDLGRLTVALDWPAFSGDLSGRLPLLRYHDGVITVGGTLEAHAFDGAIAIENLRIEQPLGIVPRIGMTVRMRNLDLARVTEIVPFGSVEGRLDVDIEGLRMLKGEPIAFDASFRTPPDDDSRHRLSQRAVDTIARVAGGGAALSTTFLRVFEHFAYDRLGIACRLENDVCVMDGVGEVDGGYYIVKGAWIPRVDLIGRVRRVRWSRLVEQLDEALNEGEFTID